MSEYVWVVYYDAYGDFWVSAVFDSEEKAEAYVGERRGDYVITDVPFNPEEGLV